MATANEQNRPSTGLPERFEVVPASRAAFGATAGYDPEQDTWHVEIHQPGQPVERIGIHDPLTADEPTARKMAEQIAENRGLPYIDDNTGLIPPRDLSDMIRAAAWMQGEDDPSLLQEIVSMREYWTMTIRFGMYLTRGEEEQLTRVLEQEPEPDGTVTFDTEGVQVVTGEEVAFGFDVDDDSGIYRLATPAAPTDEATTRVVCAGPPEAMRNLGLALIIAAKKAESLQAQAAKPDADNDSQHLSLVRHADDDQ